MQAIERLLEIEESFKTKLQRIVPIELEDFVLRVILYLKDGTNVRVTELWEKGVLKRYSYYWLTSDNKLKIGWDNAPHHKQLENYPHHKHIDEQNNIHSSSVTCLEQVMEKILPTITEL